VAGNPFVEPGRRAADPLPAPPPGFRLDEDSTHLLALPHSEQAFWDGMLSTAQRNDWRRLAKKGVTVEESRAERDADAVYELYRASFAHWGGEPRFAYNREFYRALLALGGEAVRLTVVRQEGGLASGCFVLRWNNKVHYLAGFFDREERASRPAVLLQMESILRAVRDGYRWYDFLPSGGHSSVEVFKEGFGGRRVPLATWTRRGGLHRLRPGA
jgi:CelD/BcsL family acetyltransferase involved in cellulose biosynthesis